MSCLGAGWVQERISAGYSAPLDFMLAANNPAHVLRL
jgi:hypothetical protein